LDLAIGRIDYGTFGGALVPDMDSGSLFHFFQHCGMADSRDLLAFLIPSPADFLEMTDANVINPQHFRNNLPDIRIQIQNNLIHKSGLKPRIT